MRRASILEIGYWVSCTGFFLFWSFFMFNFGRSKELSDLGIDSTAPANLRRSPESFRTSLAVERRGKEPFDIFTSESWRELENKVSGYATRLEVIEKNHTRQQYGVMIGYVVSAFSMMIFGVMKRRASKDPAETVPAG